MNTRGRVRSVVERILGSIEDGVLVVDRGGRIVTWNAAASRIPRAHRGPCAGVRTSRRPFLLSEGLDAFSQAVLDAVASEAEMGRRVVEIEVGGAARSLAMTTTYLRGDAHAKGRGEAVVAVFSDLTEVAALRGVGARAREEG